MKAILTLIPTLAVLYGTFLLGQVNMRRKYKDRRDPLPIIQAARNVCTTADMGGVAPSNLKTQVQLMQLALDDWDLKPSN